MQPQKPDSDFVRFETVEETNLHLVFQLDNATGKEAYVGFIFRDRETGLYIGKDKEGKELFPRTERLEGLKENFKMLFGARRAELENVRKRVDRRLNRNDRSE